MVEVKFMQCNISVDDVILVQMFHPFYLLDLIFISDILKILQSNLFYNLRSVFANFEVNPGNHDYHGDDDHNYHCCCC